MNGPPGTGKTSLLRAVIADEWIKPLISEEEFPDCPIIIACAATNQAVTNIISSFDSVPGSSLFDEEGERTNHPASLESRWLPHLVSYGWYQPASKGNSSAEYQGFQVISRRSPKQCWEFDFAAKEFGNAEKNISYLEYCYLTVASEFLNNKENIFSIAEILRDKIKDTVKWMDQVSGHLIDWAESLKKLKNLAENIRETKESYELITWNIDVQSAERQTPKLNSEVEIVKSRLSQLFNLKRELSEEFQPSFYKSMIRFITLILLKNKKSIRRDNLGKLLTNLGLELPKDHASFIICLVSINEKIEQLNHHLQKKCIERDNVVKNNRKAKQLKSETTIRRI